MANETIEEQRERDYQFHLDIAEKIAPTWEKRRAEIEEYATPVRQWMLRELDPHEGDTLLELAAGVGDTGFEAAAIIGESGRLITSDFSPAMLDAARRRGAELGLGNVDYRVINAERIDLDDDSVDGVLCRFGYMLMPDPVAAFVETRRVLRPGGRVALAVWGAMERNPWIAIAGISLGQRGHIPPPPPPPAPGPFSMASAERVESLLREAGFTEVRIEEAHGRFAIEDADDYLGLIGDTAGPVGLALQGLGITTAPRSGTTSTTRSAASLSTAAATSCRAWRCARWRAEGSRRSAPWPRRRRSTGPSWPTSSTARGSRCVFVHGGVGDYREWELQVPAFAASFRTITLSCRGAWPNRKLEADEKITLDTFVEDLAAFIKALDLAPVHLVGHSSPGGFGGLLLAYRYPELLRSLVLLEPPAFPLLGVNIPPTPPQVLKLLARNPRAGIGFIKFGARGIGPAMKAFNRGDDEGGLRVFMTAVAGKERVAAIPEETFQAFVGNVGPFKAQLRAGFPQFGEDDARSIRVPTLLVSGADSPAPLTAVTDRLEEVLPDVSRLNIAGAGHNMFNTHPTEFNAGVMEFIGRH